MEIFFQKFECRNRNWNLCFAVKSHKSLKIAEITKFDVSEKYFDLLLEIK